MKHWLFQVMYDLYPQSWKGMVEMGIAAQQYPLSLKWDNAKRNNNALKKLKEGDAVIASFKDHRFAGYGILKSDFYVGGSALRIPHLSSRELMGFRERFDCDWTTIPLDRSRPFIRCDDFKKQGFDINLMRGQCVKQVDENTFAALKQKLDISGARRALPEIELNSKANTVEKPHKYWLWVTSVNGGLKVSNSGGIKLSTCQSLGWKPRGHVDDRCGSFILHFKRTRYKEISQKCILLFDSN
jgi:hypothetical protein